MGRGIWSRFAGPDETPRHAKLAVPSDPHPPPIERKIQKANEHVCDCQNGCRDVGIDQPVQIVKQEPTLIGLDSGFPFEPVLEQSQGTWPRKQFSEDSPDERHDMACNRVLDRAH